jgi:hypothetical protein
LLPINTLTEKKATTAEEQTVGKARMRQGEGCGRMGRRTFKGWLARKYSDSGKALWEVGVNLAAEYVAAAEEKFHPGEAVSILAEFEVDSDASNHT